MNDLFGDFTPDYSALATSYEPNDTAATATTLTEGSYEIDGSGVDWYRFEVVSGEIALTLTPTSSFGGMTQDMNFALYRDPEGNALRGGLQSGDAVENINFTAGADGTYYLKVYWAQYPTGHPDGQGFSYQLDVDLPEVMASDGNDTLETASTLSEGSSVHHGTGIDWYRIDTLSGQMSVSLAALEQSDGSHQNLNMTLYNAAGVALKGGQGDAISETLSHLSATDGTYYLRVISALYPNGAPNGVTLDYSLTLDLPEEQVSDGNDTRETATMVDGSSSIAVSGTNIDWYQIDTGPGQMDFTLTAAEQSDGSYQNLNLILYDADGTGLRANHTDGMTEAFSYNALGEGTYYLRVSWESYPGGTPNGLTMDYRLDVDLPRNTWVTELDFGPIRASSVAAYDIDRDGEDEIFIGTSKSIDAEGNEVLPAGFIVLEADGSVKWTQTFAAVEGVDPATGKTYETSSVSTAPTFSDVDGDGSIDIVVGVGGDNGKDEFGVVGQPGDDAGVYALNADGTIKWFFQTRNSFGDDERPDGVYGAARVFDIDSDGVREVIFTSWDHYLYILDGRTGELERELNLHDTAGAVPNLADVDGDGLYELVVASDITSNANAGLPAQGGILQVLSNYAIPNIEGWMDQIGTSTSADFRGKFEEQSLWSSPQVVDLDKDGTVEIVQGTGDYFKDERGHYVKVWNADGTLRYELATDGRVLAAPLIADLDGNGTSEIVAVTTDGAVHAWTANGTEIFATRPIPYGSDETDDLQIVRSPVAVDMTGDGKLEILVSIGNQMIALDSAGNQISGLTEADRVFNTYSGSPLAKDIDGDGYLDLISGGTLSNEQAVVYRFENPYEVQADDFRTAAYQGNQSLNDIRDFVGRFYSTILGRSADPAGSNSWTDLLYTGVKTGADVARGFIYSAEFQNRGTSNGEYVQTLYSAFFGRAADAGGLAGWTQRLDDGTTRASVLNGFINSQEFANIATSYGIRVDSSYGAASDAAVITGEAGEANTLRGGAGDNVIYDEGTTVVDTVPDKEAAGQVFRLYGATLGRAPDANGFEFNTGSVSTRSLEAVARGFVEGREFAATYGDLDNAEFVSLLYRNVLGREADAAGLAGWTAKLDGGTSRIDVVLGFSESLEYRLQTQDSLDAFMRSANLLWTDVIEGGAGNDTVNGGFGADVLVFRADETGTDVVHGFEPWDELQLSGFGFETATDAISHMSRSGANVVFSYAGETITFLNTTMTEMQRVRYNVS